MNDSTQTNVDKAAHTPAPWKVGTHPNDVFDAYNHIIVTAYGRDNGDENAANAAHIVRCVNSHDALVEALSDMIARCPTLAPCKIFSIFLKKLIDMPCTPW